MRRKRILLGEAGLLWLVAGLNVGRMGLSLVPLWSGIRLLFALAVFLFFWEFVFKRVYRKNSRRILSLPGKPKLYQWLDRKSFFVMIFMISLGMLLRGANIMPNRCLGMLYTGLGTALVLAGLAFLFRSVKHKEVSL